MIITCPECNARFVLPEKALGAEGRTVRCGKCRHTWHKSPTQHTPDDIKKLSAAREEARKQQIKAVKSGASGEKTFLPALSVKTKAYHQWIIFGVCLLWIVLATLYLFGPSIIHKYGFTQPVYKKLGIIPTEGMRIYDTKVEKIKQYGRDSLSISGVIVNESDVDRYVPNLQIIQKNDLGKILDISMLKSGFPILHSKEETPYRNIVTIVSPDVSQVVIDIGDAITLNRRSKE